MKKVGIHSEETKEKMKLAHMGEKNHFFGKKHTKETIKKLSELKKGKTTWSKGIKFSDEHRLKLSLAKKGKRPPNYIEDRTLIKGKQNRNNPEYKQWRISVFKRDSYKCKINCDCEGKIVAHHILPWSLYPELRHEINNGITLCKKHHPRKRQEEINMVDDFKKMLCSETIN